MALEPVAAEEHLDCRLVDGRVICSERFQPNEDPSATPPRQRRHFYQPPSRSRQQVIRPLPEAATPPGGGYRQNGRERAARRNGEPTAARTSRSFFGPHEYPPETFAAYGIVAFPARAATEEARERHLNACRAYIATLPTPSELSVPRDEQMVTVWPLDDSRLAAELTERTDFEVCETAVERYHLATALSALAHARLAGRDAPRGRGPFLLAWSPASQKGEADALVLVADLSSAFAYWHFEDYFRQWREDIEQSPELWERGWSPSLVRARIRDWADRWGMVILSVRRGE
jgi:hypothetical protein